MIDKKNFTNKTFYIFLPNLQTPLCILFVIVSQSLSHVSLFMTPCTAARQASLSLTICQSLLKLMSIESVMLSNHHLLSSPSPAFNLSQHQGLL